MMIFKHLSEDVHCIHRTDGNNADTPCDSCMVLQTALIFTIIHLVIGWTDRQMCDRHTILHLFNFVLINN